MIGAGKPLAPSVLKKMRDVIAHRGPDGEGAWFGSHPLGSVAFGFRRLAIIDPRQVSDQPMVSSDGRKAIVFNGEIYNYVELRNQLKALGRTFQTLGDTEVLLQAYEQWGEAVVDRLNGMFAFAIWDEVRGQIFVARDRFGEKPLFLCHLLDGKLALASEIKSLLAHPMADRGYDLDMFGRVLNGHLIFGTEDTLFRSVRQMRAGYCMTVSPNGGILREWSFWKPSYDRSLENTPWPVLESRLREKLVHSLKLRMRSDVEMTACLSGGLDSSALVGLLAGMNGADSERKGVDSTISVRFPDDPTIDEGQYIDMVLGRTGFRGHAISPTATEMMRDLRQMHWHHETIIPGPSMYLEWSLMREARELGHKVILDGQGADEILAGYATYFKAHQAELAKKGVGGLAEALRLGGIRKHRLRQTAKLYKEPSRRFSVAEGLNFKELLVYHRRWLPSRIREYGCEGLPDPQDVGALRFDLALNLLRTSLPSNLYSGDRNSMAHGIECRYPYLDYDLVDFTTRLPDRAFLANAWGKVLLRHSVSEILPEKVVWRADKVGFAAPQDRWLASAEASNWLSERIFDQGLQSIPGHSTENLQKLWLNHKNGSENNSAVLWRWASAAELIDMGRSGVWS